MAVVQTGTVLEFNLNSYGNTGTVSSTITVPADADFVVVGVSGYSGTANYFSGGSMTFTKGGSQVAMTSAGGGADSNTGLWMGAQFYMVAPDTGTNKTLAWDWVGAGGPGDAFGKVSVTFWKGVDQTTPVRDSDGAQAGGFPKTTPTLTAQSGDKIIAFVAIYNDSEATVDSWSNLTELAELTRNGSADGAWATGDPTGNVAVAASTTTNGQDGGIIAIVVQAAAESGATGTGTVTLSGLAVSAAASQQMAGVAALALNAASLAAQGVMQPAGAGAIDLAGASISASGVHSVPGADGAAALTFAAPILAGQGAQTIPGAGALGLLAAVIQSSGIMQPAGAGALTLGQFTIAATGLITVPGISMAGLDLIAIAASASQAAETASTAAVVLPGAVVAGAAQLQISGAVALSLQPPALSALAAHFLGVNGVGAVALSPAALAAAGSLAIPPAAGAAAIDLGVVSVAGNASLSVPAAAALNLLAAQIAAIATSTAQNAVGTVILPRVVIVSAGATDIVVLPSELLGVIEFNPAIYASVGLLAAISATPETEPAVAGGIDL